MGAIEEDWVAVLRQACTSSSQGKVAEKIGYSAPVISAVLKGSYRASTEKIEQAVRGVLMNGKGQCPALGTIGAHRCLEHQKGARKRLMTNPLRTRMTRACRKCRRFTGETS